METKWKVVVWSRRWSCRWWCYGRCQHPTDERYAIDERHGRFEMVDVV